jgi:hypothetical protein
MSGRKTAITLGCERAHFGAITSVDNRTVHPEWHELWAALRRARVPIWSVAATYLIFLLLGTICVHSGCKFALDMRDRVVGHAVKQDRAAIAARNGHRLRAAAYDFAQNLLLGAIPNTVGGLAIVLPYPVIAYRAWVGGIVSVDSRHRSRLAQTRSALAFITVLLLQLIPYTLAGGMGVYLGVAYLRRSRLAPGETRLLGVPRLALLDVLRVYAIIVPLFAVASLVEFYAL